MFVKTIAFACAVGLIMIARTSIVSSAESERSVAQYTFVVANAPKDASSNDARLRLRLMRWSTDDERRLLKAALDDSSNLLSALPYVAVAGYLQWPGGLEHSVRYARQTVRPDATGAGFRRDSDTGIMISNTTPALLTDVRRESVK